MSNVPAQWARAFVAILTQMVSLFDSDLAGTGSISDLAGVENTFGAGPTRYEKKTIGSALHQRLLKRSGVSIAG